MAKGVAGTFRIQRYPRGMVGVNWDRQPKLTILAPTAFAAFAVAEKIWNVLLKEV